MPASKLTAYQGLAPNNLAIFARLKIGPELLAASGVRSVTDREAEVERLIRENTIPAPERRDGRR